PGRVGRGSRLRAAGLVLARGVVAGLGRARAVLALQLLLAGLAIRIRLPRVGGPGLRLLELGVAAAGLAEEVLDDAGVLGDRVGDELEGGGQADTGLAAHLAAEHPGGALERGGGALALLVGAEDGVEDGGVLEVAGDAHVGDRHEAETRVLDPGGWEGGDEDLDAGGPAEGGGGVVHGVAFPWSGGGWRGGGAGARWAVPGGAGSVPGLGRGGGRPAGGGAAGAVSARRRLQ